ncbi:MAG: asparagine synthase (glutamine-hydrolyzing) [Patescibacteria group bacterium]
MCGIIGVLGNIPQKNEFESARETMNYRGPDDAGLYYSKKEGVALGHRRLSIIDLTVAGHQPFFSADKRYVLTYNGEIYNYLEIKKQLENFYDFKTKTDTEVLLAAYIKWGVKCLNKLNGMFAFAIWDRKEEKLFLARDQFGIKPLFFCEADGVFYFSSEIKGIIQFKNIPRKLNRRGFLDYLSYRYVLGGETLFAGIKSALPGHYLVVKNDQPIKQFCYWKLPVVIEKKDPGEKEALAMTTELLKQSVRLRLRSDVPVGAYLSGGLDSSVLVALASGFSDQPLKTFSVGFKEENFSELEYARIVAKKFNTDHREYTMRGDEYFDLLSGAIGFKDAPLLSPNEPAWFFLSKEIRKDVTVVLAGGGADELFGGYGRILRSGYDWERMANNDDFSASEKKKLFVNLNKKYGALKFDSPLAHFLGQYSYLGIEHKRALVSPEILDGENSDWLNHNFFRKIFKGLNKLSATDQYLRVFQTVHLLGTLESLDAMSMPASIEARVPYVDKDLIEFVSGLPLKYKMPWRSVSARVRARVLNSDQISEKQDITKYLLRKIGDRCLPAEIMKRKKMGFPVPLDKWFVGGKFEKLAKDVLLSPNAKSLALYNRKPLEDLLNHRTGMVGKNHGLHIWMMMNMEMWLNQYNVSI